MTDRPMCLSARTGRLLPRTLLDLITALRDSASLLRADHVVLRRAQMSHSDRMLRALTDVRCRVAVRSSCSVWSVLHCIYSAEAESCIVAVCLSFVLSVSTITHERVYECRPNTVGKG